MLVVQFQQQQQQPLTTALGETYIVILGQIAKGKISLADLSTKKVQREMQHEFKAQMKKASKLAI